MAETTNDFMDRLVAARNKAREAASEVRRIANEAPSERIEGRRGGAARSLAAGIKAIGVEMISEAERLERKL